MRPRSGYALPRVSCARQGGRLLRRQLAGFYSAVDTGVGPIIAATVRAAVQDPAALRTGRDLAAWIGITPTANSSGGKERLGKISKRGNKQLRTLLIVGATSILKQARRGSKLPGWVVSLMARRPVAAVALANKMARTIWALLVKGGTYQAPSMAKA